MVPKKMHGDENNFCAPRNGGQPLLNNAAQNA
jgi:hypothetical protein